ncbi:MAG: hypothetical protein ACRC1K_16050 [Planctomycetia bacterium]
MSNEMLAFLTSDDFAIDADEFTLNFRERYGSHGLGLVEEDPEQLEYEEMLELGQSLGARLPKRRRRRRAA